jgi:excinuclease ABC subunit C
MKQFDAKLGTNYLKQVPALPGIYRIYDSELSLIYVGKAKNLKRRLSQYRNARRRKKHYKMRKIVSEAVRIEFEVCASELDAILLELQLIQNHRPKWNVAGAFYFLYPLIGMRFVEGEASFCYTTEPERFREFEFHGAYRSRQRTRDAFFALMNLLPFLCHRVRQSKKKNHEVLPKYSYVYRFRQLSQEWQELWTLFWKGESREALEMMILALVENAGARRNPEEIQGSLNLLSRFWRHEAIPLKKARKRTEFLPYPVPQKERDLIFLKYRAVLNTGRKSTHNTKIL